MNRLDIAIKNFEDETLDMTLGERISDLRNALTWAAFYRLQRIHKFGKKSRESEDDEYKQVESWKQFKIIESMYNSQMKHNKLAGKAAEEGMDSKEMLKIIREQKSTMGSIVRNMNEGKTDEANNNIVNG